MNAPNTSQVLNTPSDLVGEIARAIAQRDDAYRALLSIARGNVSDAAAFKHVARNALPICEGCGGNGYSGGVNTGSGEFDDACEQCCGTGRTAHIPENLPNGVARERLLSGNGWVFFNPDTGEEFALNHPVESGEVPDATDIRRSTPQEDTLHAAYQAQWRASANGVSVREECAKVAARNAGTLCLARGHDDAEGQADRWYQGAIAASREIAAAIRAMPLSTLEGEGQ